MKVLSGITTFNPNVERLKKNIEAILGQTDQVLVVDNNSKNIEQISAITKNYPSVELLRLNENKGIAYAMNEMGKYAYKNGYEWFLTLDQDSVCPENMILTYIDGIKEGVAIIFPSIKFNGRFIGQLFGEKRIEENKNIQDYEEAKYAVSSGQFIKTSVWKEVGGFWDYLFIDYVDQEFCFHVRSIGYKLIKANRCIMDHEPGIPVKVFGIPTAKQSALREYYCSRNSRLVYWLYKKEFKSAMPHTPFFLGIKRVANTILVRENVINKLWAISKGVVDAYKWKMKYYKLGRYPENIIRV